MLDRYLLLTFGAPAFLLTLPLLAQGDGLSPCEDRLSLLNQAPVAERGGIASNLTSSQTTAADNFVLSAPSLISRVVFWGFYGQDSPEPEQFTLRFHADDAGTPLFATGDPVFNAVVPVRSEWHLQTGTLFRFVADIEPLLLPSGIHWIEIFATGAAPAVAQGLDGVRVEPRGPPLPGAQNFTWQFGALDMQNGIQGFAFGFSTLSPEEEGNLAVELCGPDQSHAVPGIPTIDSRGVAVLFLLVTGAAAVLLRQGNR